MTTAYVCTHVNITYIITIYYILYHIYYILDYGIFKDIKP